MPTLRSPLAVPALAGPLQLVAGVTGAVIGLAGLAAAGSLVVRFRRARGVERQQLRWVALVVTTWVPVAALVAIVANLLDHPGVGSWGPAWPCSGCSWPSTPPSSATGSMI